VREFAQPVKVSDDDDLAVDIAMRGCRGDVLDRAVQHDMIEPRKIAGSHHVQDRAPPIRQTAGTEGKTVADEKDRGRNREAKRVAYPAPHCKPIALRCLRRRPRRLTAVGPRVPTAGKKANRHRRSL